LKLPAGPEFEISGYSILISSCFPRAEATRWRVESLMSSAWFSMREMAVC
jgi:hypothetical protein